MAFKTVNGRPMADIIANHLLRVGSISALEAQGMYKCRSLSRRICDLKGRGMNIVSVEKRDHTGQRYVRYVLAGQLAQRYAEEIA